MSGAATIVQQSQRTGGMLGADDLGRNNLQSLDNTLDVAREAAKHLSLDERVALVARICEHSVRDGIKLALDLKLPGRNLLQALTASSVQAKQVGFNTALKQVVAELLDDAGRKQRTVLEEALDRFTTQPSAPATSRDLDGL